MIKVGQTELQKVIGLNHDDFNNGIKLKLKLTLPVPRSQWKFTNVSYLLGMIRDFQNHPLLVVRDFAAELEILFSKKHIALGMKRVLKKSENTFQNTQNSETTQKGNYDTIGDVVNRK